jgi:hypothetical protein
MAVTATRTAALALVAVLLAGPVQALVPDLGPTEVQEAIELGRQSIVQEDFGDEWRLALSDGAEIVVTTPFSRLTLAARQAAFKSEPLSDKARQEAIDRSKGKLQLVVAMVGPAVDFARWFQPVLMVGSKEVKPAFAQNERTALKREDGRFVARNVYVFPLEGLPPRGSVTLVVRHAVDGKEVLKTSLDLSAFR